MSIYIYKIYPSCISIDTGNLNVCLNMCKMKMNKFVKSLIENNSFFFCPNFVQYYSNCIYLCLFCPGLCFEMYSTDRQREGCEIFYPFFFFCCCSGGLIFGVMIVSDVKAIALMPG